MKRGSAEQLASMKRAWAGKVSDIQFCSVGCSVDLVSLAGLLHLLVLVAMALSGCRAWYHLHSPMRDCFHCTSRVGFCC